MLIWNKSANLDLLVYYKLFHGREDHQSSDKLEDSMQKVVDHKYQKLYIHIYSIYISIYIHIYSDLNGVAKLVTRGAEKPNIVVT